MEDTRHGQSIPILWDLLSQWKAVLVVALLCSVAITTYKYLRDSKTYQAALAQAQEEQQRQASMSEEEAIEHALSVLNVEERAAVEALVDQQELLNAQLDILDSSILLGLDSSNQRLLVNDYLLTSNEGAEVQALAASYKSMFTEDVVMHDVGAVIDPSASLPAIAELCSFTCESAQDSNAKELIMTISIVLPSENIDVEKLSHVVDTAISDINSRLNERIGAHSAAVVSHHESINFTESAVNRKQNIISAINSNRAAIQANSATLNANQKAAFSAISSAMNRAREEKELIKEDADDQSEPSASAKASSSNNMPTPPSLSAKFAIAGMAIGAMVYAIGYVILTILRGSIGSEVALHNCTGSRILGGLYYPSTHNGLGRLFHSGFVDKRRYANMGSVKEQIAKTSSTIGSVCKHAAISDVCILNMAAGSIDSSMLAGLVSNLSIQNIQAQVVDINPYADEQKLLPVRHAIYCADCKTKAVDVWKIANLTRSYDIAELGCVYVRGY